MTARELYEYALTELNKLEAPSLLLEDYNYFINKAVQQYLNLVYAKLEIDQQSTDDIRVLKASTILTPSKLSTLENPLSFGSGLFRSSYYVDLPEDYTHLLNCVIEYTVSTSNYKCYNKNDKVYFAARRLTPDMYTQILNNAYLKPMYKRPYYYITNYNTDEQIVTNEGMDEAILDNPSVAHSATPAAIADFYSAKSDLVIAEANYKSDPDDVSYQEAYNAAYTAYHTALDAVAPVGSKIDSQTETGDRLANPSVVRLELRFGDDSVFTPTQVYIDYVKAPMYIRLTQEQIDHTLDTSQVLEFPDYVCFEIVNIFTRLLMENASDPRIQTNIPLNQTISVPQQQQTNSKK